MKVPVIENVLKFNDDIAAMNRNRFVDADVFVIDLIGSPGSGKTQLLVETLRQFEGRMGIVVGDLATTRDAERLMAQCEDVVQINTNTGCHLDANQVRHAIEQLDLEALDVLVIENVGNLICPVGFDLGQHCKAGVFSRADGDDKAAKHPHLVRAANVLILNKMDLAPHVPFDETLFRNDIEFLNPQVKLVKTTALTGQIAPWLDWIKENAQRDVNPLPSIAE